MHIAVIGGGAAGFFAAIAVKENFPDASVIIFEKSKRLLTKVAVSGGGRCNVTNGCSSIKELVEGYPRGGKALKKAFHIFGNQHLMEWFEARGVPLFIQEDGRVFPKSERSQSIIDCLQGQSEKLGVEVKMSSGIRGIALVQDGVQHGARNGLQLSFAHEAMPDQHFDKVIVASGGSPKRKGLEWLETLGHEIVDPVPSLFSFNMPGESITSLMGISVGQCRLRIQGEKLQSDGPLLITHWGMSGPAILKLSAFGARRLHEKKYVFEMQVNWVDVQNCDVVMKELVRLSEEHPHKRLVNVRHYGLPERLWKALLERSELSEDKKWGELGKKGRNKLVDLLTCDVYSVEGKTTFKEEFVTCGGVSLESIDMNTMQSKVCPGLYFAGELMDIDGITGGYNFQAAWTTAFIAGQLISATH